MKWFAFRVARAALPALGLAVLLIPLSASSTRAERSEPGQLRSWVIEHFEAEVRVLKSGEIVVTETIQPRFEGSYNGIYRTIPVDYRTDAGFSYKLRLDLESVTDQNGNALRYEISREGKYRKIKIWVPGAQDATKTVVIQYRVRNGLRFFDSDDEREGVVEAYDELYWNVTGDEWPVPIESASATIVLPAEATGIRAHAFTGAYGSREQAAAVTRTGNRVHIETNRGLEFREGLTVGVAWNPGVVERPSAVDKATSLLSANLPLLLPVLAFFGMLRIWSARGRDPKLGSITARYEPPEGLTPAEVGVIIDNSADMRDVTATIVDLAVRGYLVIEETEEEKLFGLVKDRDYDFRSVRGPETWAELESHERKLLRALFGGSDRVSVSELENEFYKDLPGIKDSLMRSLVKHGVYVKRPDHVMGRWIAGAIGMGIAITAIGIFLGPALGLSPLAVGIGGIGTGIVMLVFGILMPARTERGTRLLADVKGFEEFLERVESDRFKRMITGPEMFEKLLPFAMALGVEQQWAKAFEGIYREPPEWYHGTHYRTFHPHVFVTDLGGMTTRAASAMTSAPRSSGGSSFSGGGGFSGGGFGGGGGGAF